MKKRKMLARYIVAIVLSFMMAATPLSAYAATGVKYAKNDSDNPSKRTGIQSVVIDGKTYYDVYSGESTKGSTDDQFRFLKDALTSKPSDADDNAPNDKSAYENWAMLATNIFGAGDNVNIATQRHEGSFQRDFIDRGSDNSDRAGYAYLPERLASVDSWSMGKRRSDYSAATGLKLAKNLDEVRTATAESLIWPLKTKYSAEDILDNTNGDDTLDALKDETDQDVLYNLVTCIDNTGATSKYTYTVFGMAFYDFQMHVLTSDDLEYITAAEGYDNIEQAANSGAEGVKYQSTSDAESKVVSYYENGSKEDASISMGLVQTNSETVSNSLENSSTYTYGETIGMESKLSAQIPFTVANETSLKLEFTAEQALSTAYKEEKSVSKETRNEVSTTMTLPAHTAAEIESADGETSITLDYDCPVVLTYKVAIFSLCGDIYEDTLATRSMSTSRYSQGYFQTIFGADNEKGGVTAQENLYNRALKYGDTPSYDQVYGQTYGWHDMHNDGNPPESVNYLDWSKILSSELSEEAALQPTVPITVECIEVNEDGEVQNDGEPFNQYTYGGKGFWNYTMSVSAVENYPNLDSKNYDYNLFTGLTDPGTEATEDEEGVPAQINAGLTQTKSGVWQKDITPSYDPITNEKNTTVKFYYTKSETDPDSTETSTSGKVSGTATAEIPAATNTGLADLDKSVKQLATYIPMSASGGTITYNAKGMSSKIQGIVPMYPLDSTRIKSSQKVFNMTVGDEINLDNIEVAGYNQYDVPYYGFNQDKGHWIIVDKDGNELKDGDIVAFDQDANTGNELLKANGEGTVYLKYMIDENTYTSQNNTKPVKNSALSSSAQVKINVDKAAFAGRVEANGTLVGYVGDSAINLDDTEDVEVYVFDQTGKEIEDTVVTWQSEKAESRGIVLENNQLSFTKPGDYKIRAVYNGGSEPTYSDWITVTAKAARELDNLTIADNKDPKVLETITLGDNETEINLGDLTLSGKDQYGDKWDELDDLKWYVDGEEIKPDKSTGIERYIYTAKEAGEHKIYAECGGVKSNELSLIVSKSIEYLKVGDTFEDGLYAYEVTNDNHDGSGTVTVIGFAKGKSAKSVKIPSTAVANYDDNDTTYIVTAIGSKAFYKNKKITSVNTGNNVTTIGKNAFYGCTAMKSLTLGEKITKLEKHSFCQAKKLKKIVIYSSKLKTVGSPHVFYKVSKAKVYVPAKCVKKYKKLLKPRGLKNSTFKKLKTK